MRCERCGERDAEVHLTSIRNAEARTERLCQTCADSRIGEGVPDDLKRQFAVLMGSCPPLTDEDLEAIRRFYAALAGGTGDDDGQGQRPPSEGQGAD